MSSPLSVLPYFKHYNFNIKKYSALIFFNLVLVIKIGTRENGHSRSLGHTVTKKQFLTRERL